VGKNASSSDLKQTIQNKKGWFQMQRYLNFSELRAKLGGRSRSAIYIDLATGRLPPPLKLGGRLYWPEGDLEVHLGSMRGDVA
jgi:prophage regulatory protein